MRRLNFDPFRAFPLWRALWPVRDQAVAGGPPLRSGSPQRPAPHPVGAAERRALPGRLRNQRRRWRLARRGLIGLLIVVLAAEAALALRELNAAGGALPILSQGLLTLSADLGFTLRQVSIEGAKDSQPAAVEAALGIRPGQPILAFDPAAARARLEAMPWVRQAAVERYLPGTIVVRLIERRPVALWQRPEGYELVDDTGTPIATADIAPYVHLPVVVGDNAPRHTPGLLEMLDSEPELARHVTAAVWVGDRRWNVQLDGRVIVRLPEDDPMSAWARLADLNRREHILDHAIAAIDMRLGDRLVLKLDPGVKVHEDYGVKTHGDAA